MLINLIIIGCDKYSLSDFASAAKANDYKINKCVNSKNHQKWFSLRNMIIQVTGQTIVGNLRKAYNQASEGKHGSPSSLIDYLG